MKFTLAASSRYWWPVTVLVPDPDNPGTFAEQTLQMQFEAKMQDEMLDEHNRLGAIRDLKQQAQAERKILADLCMDWKDVVSPGGDPVPFSRANLESALQISWFRAGAWRAYHESQNGQAARLGN